MPESLIKLDGVTKVFLTDEIETHALSGINLDIKQGEYVSIAGPSGCGKSTLLSILGLLDSPTDGSYVLNGRPVQGLSLPERARIRNREIGFIFQSFNLIGDLTVYENVELPLTYRGMPAAERKAAATGALEKVGMAHRAKHLPSQLSGGQQQQLAIGRVLLTNPKLLILDEPTEGIQPSIIDQIGDTLKKLKAPRAPADVFQRAAQDVQAVTLAVQHLKQEHSLAILLVEQYVDFCREVADRYYAMDRGAVVVSGEIATLTDDVVKKHLQV